MKTYSPQVRKLINSVKRSLTKSERIDLINHGIDGGFGQFVYFADTMKFYNRHKEAIWELLEDTAEAYDEPPLKVLSYFKPGGEPETLAMFENKMCWWSVSRVCEILEMPDDEDDSE